MAIEKKQYTDEFKNKIIELYNSGKTITELSSEYAVAKSTINEWIKKNKTILVDNNKIVTAAEYNKLLKKMSQLKEENEILKKAIDTFTRK